MVDSLKNGDFIKLQNLILGYSLPKPVLNKIGVERLRIFAQGQDVWMSTKYTGIDPEMENGGVDFNGHTSSESFHHGY